MSRNNDYTKGNLSDDFCHKNYEKLIGINFSRQKNKFFSQQINFIGKLEEDYGATMLFIAENQQKTILNFSLNPLNVTEKIKQWIIKKY